MIKLSKAQKGKFLANLRKFSLVFLAALFGQLALGVSLKQSIPFALAILWGALVDFYKKAK
ncbi:hypothetical protein LCGC14_2260070 [marine sediment metagenome]|uniref:Uncharacterized protein n=1 Tax=marine sediment metagenome TaxID=412755 RepID=A0A0F9FV00_9ZZZZ